MRVLAIPDGRRKSATLQLQNAHTVNRNPSYDHLEITEVRMCVHTQTHTQSHTHTHTVTWLQAETAGGYKCPHPDS